MGERLERPVVAIYTEGNAAVGLGHVRRGLALASELAASCNVCVFLRGSPEAGELIHRAGFRCVPVPDFETVLADVDRACAAALVVDSYEVTASDYAAARARGLVLVAVDDLGREPLSVDVLVNPAPRARTLEDPSGVRCLLGPRFALLHRDFAVSVAREVRNRVETVLLVLGGATPSMLTAALARVIRRSLPEAVIDVVVGPIGERPATVSVGLSGLDGVRIHVAPESLRSLMLATDLAVSSGGVTVFELAATGTPAVGLEVASNQRPNLEGMAEAGTLAVGGRAGEAGFEEALRRALTNLAGDVERRRAMSERGRALVDGRGAARVAEVIRVMLAQRRQVRGSSR